MRDLEAFTERLVDDPHAADQLRIADSYIRQYKELGRRFALPAEYEYLKPVVEIYAHDHASFVRFVKQLRDTVPPRQESYIALHELYRTLLVRQVQHERRERITKAVEWLKKTHPLLTAQQRAAWARKTEQEWGKRRMRLMEDVRRTTASNRLNTDEREMLLEAFWKEIDKEIEQGKLPRP